MPKAKARPRKTTKPKSVRAKEYEKLFKQIKKNAFEIFEATNEATAKAIKDLEKEGKIKAKQAKKHLKEIKQFSDKEKVVLEKRLKRDGAKLIDAADNAVFKLTKVATDLSEKVKKSTKAKKTKKKSVKKASGKKASVRKPAAKKKVVAKKKISKKVPRKRVSKKA